MTESKKQRNETLRKVEQFLVRYLRYQFFFPVPGISTAEELISQFIRSRRTVDERVEEAISSLTRSSELVAQLDTELKGKLGDLNKMRTEYQKYSELSKIELEKAQPLLDQLAQTVARGRGRERAVSVGLNIAIGLGFFIAGAIFSSPLQATFQGLWTALTGAS